MGALGALERTARPLKAGVALVFFALVTLAVLAPQDARAPAPTVILNAPAGDGQVTLFRTTGTTSGLTGSGAHSCDPKAAGGSDPRNCLSVPGNHSGKTPGSFTCSGPGQRHRLHLQDGANDLLCIARKLQREVTATPAALRATPPVASTNLCLAPRSDGFVVICAAPTDANRNGWTLSFKKTRAGSAAFVANSNAAATGRTLTGPDAGTAYTIGIACPNVSHCSWFDLYFRRPRGSHRHDHGRPAGVTLSKTSLMADEGISATCIVTEVHPKTHDAPGGLTGRPSTAPGEGEFVQIGSVSDCVLRSGCNVMQRTNRTRRSFETAFPELHVCNKAAFHQRCRMHRNDRSKDEQDEQPRACYTAVGRQKSCKI